MVIIVTGNYFVLKPINLRLAGVMTLRFQVLSLDFPPEGWLPPRP